MDSKNFNDFYYKLERKLEPEILKEIFIPVNKLEEFALATNQVIKENEGNIGKITRDFFEPFLQKNIFILKPDVIKRINDKEDYENFYDANERIKILNKNGLDKDIIQAFHQLRSISNLSLHWSVKESNHLNKIQLVNGLYSIYLVLWWYSGSINQINFNSNNYYFDEINDVANIKIKGPFSHEPNKLIVVNDQKILNVLFDSHIKFYIPIYQRSYSWDEIEVDELFFDLKKRMFDKKEHFFGSVTLIKSNEIKRGNIKVKEIKIVDGQQRFTTIVLILRAIYDRYIIFETQKINSVDPKLDEFIRKHDIPIERFNDADSVRIFKEIWRSGKANFKWSVIKNHGDKRNEEFKKDYKENAIYKINHYIKGKVTKFSSEELDLFYQSIKKLIIGVNWIKDYNEFELFESINSKGKVLNNFDIFKNYLISMLNDEETNREKEISDLITLKFESKVPNQELKIVISDIFFKKYVYLYSNFKKIKNNYRLFSQFKETLNFVYETKNLENISFVQFVRLSNDLAKFFNAILFLYDKNIDKWKVTDALKPFLNYYYTLSDDKNISDILLIYFISDDNFEFSPDYEKILKVKKPEEFKNILKLLEIWKVQTEILNSSDLLTYARNKTFFINNLNKIILNDLEIFKDDSFFFILFSEVTKQDGLNLSILSADDFFQFLIKTESHYSPSAFKIIFTRICEVYGNQSILNYEPLSKPDVYSIIGEKTIRNESKVNDWKIDELESVSHSLGNYFIHNKVRKNDYNEIISFADLLKIFKNDNYTINLSGKNQSIESFEKLRTFTDKQIIFEFIKKRTKQFSELAGKIFDINNIESKK